MEHLTNIVEAILLVAGDAVEKRDICDKLELTKKELEKCIVELKKIHSGDSGIHLLEFNEKLQFASNPNYAKSVESVLNPIKEKELTNAMLETLAIIAYKQPVTRIDVEDIRGVDCTYSVQNLSRLGLIEAVGRRDTIGKPILFATTDEFLKRFSLSGINQLPDYEEFLNKLLEASTAATVVVEKTMFDTSEDVPEFLEGETVAIVEG